MRKLSKPECIEAMKRGCSMIKSSDNSGQMDTAMKYCCLAIDAYIMNVDVMAPFEIFEEYAFYIMVYYHRSSKGLKRLKLNHM